MESLLIVAIVSKPLYKEIKLQSLTIVGLIGRTIRKVDTWARLLAIVIISI